MTKSNLRGIPRDTVFLSYRRDDVPWAAARLADHLEHHLGVGSVFRDVNSISSGINFRDRLLDAISRSAIGLVVIGPKWHDSFDARHPEHDYVLWEVATLLRMGKKVVPVLFEDAPLSSRVLPASIDDLRFLQGTILRDDTTYGATIETLSALALSCVGTIAPTLEASVLARFFIDATADVDDLRSLLLGSPIGRGLRDRMPGASASLAEHAVCAAAFIADLVDKELLLALRTYLIEEIPRYRAVLEEELFCLEDTTESHRGK